MELDHDAIYKAYPNVVRIGAALRGVPDVISAWDKDENEVTLVQSNIDAARVTLDAEAASIAYQSQRLGTAGAGTTDTIYASIGDQLDMQYKDAINGTTTWKDHVTAVKSKYPKPS